MNGKFQTFTNTKQRVAQLVLNAFEDAIRSKAAGDKERYYEVVDSIIPWLIPHMPQEAYEIVKKKVEEVNTQVRKISNEKGKSPEEKKAEILQVKYEAAETIYPILVLTFWNSSFIAQEIEGEILEGVDDMEKLRKVRSEIIRSTTKTLVLEGEDDTTAIGTD